MRIPRMLNATAVMCATVLLLGAALSTFQVYAAQSAPAQSSPTQPDYESLAREIISNLVAKQYDKVSALYSPELAKDLPTQKLAASWESIITQLGPLQSVSSVELEDAGGMHIAFTTCVFQRLTLTLRIGFNSQGQFATFSSIPPDTAATSWKAPDYAKPELFDDRPFTVQDGHWRLPGMLTIPHGAGPFPAIVLVHGSGPNDMDEGLGVNKMFKDLAWGLASRGIAVLRYTKRSHKYGAQGTDNADAFTLKDETIDDARAAVNMLTTIPQINPKRVYVAGHSLGAFAAPRIASGDPQIAGIILMAGNTRPLETLVVEQTRYEVSLSGPITPAGQQAIDLAEKSAREFTNPDLKLGMTVNFLGTPLPASYVLDLRAYHQAEVAASLKIPILVLQGERDYNVSMADFDGWKKALAGHVNATFKSYPGLNHAFLPGTGPSSPMEYAKPNHVEQDVVDDIAAWIKGFPAK
jgi:dienelactone hydrolase